MRRCRLSTTPRGTAPQAQNLRVDAVGIQKGAQVQTVSDASLEQQPRALPSSRAAFLKRQRNQMLGVHDANRDPLILVHTRGVNRVDDERVVRRQDLHWDAVHEHVFGVNREAVRLCLAIDRRQ
jgi:hypothetical protein